MASLAVVEGDFSFLGMEISPLQFALVPSRPLSLFFFLMALIFGFVILRNGGICKVSCALDVILNHGILILESQSIL